MTNLANRILVRVRPIWAALILALSACAGAAQAQEGYSARSINVGGVERSYLLYSPRNIGSGPTPRPLVFLLHGGGGSASQIAGHVGGRLAELAERDGFYIVAPNAVGGMWDFGLGRISQSLPRRSDDRAFFEALLNDLPAQLPIDRARVFATGISRGGAASYFIACSFPGRVRAIAAVAMPLPDYLESMCAEGPPLGVAIINGVADPLVPYDGGWITIGRNRRDVVLSTDATLELWRRRNGCSDAPPADELMDPASDDTRVEKSSWSQCSAPVVLYRVEGGGHTWPTSAVNLPERLVGKISRDIDASAEIWAFFSQFD